MPPLSEDETVATIPAVDAPPPPDETFTEQVNVPLETRAATTVAVAAPGPVRLVSLDAYRGFVMLLMMAEILHFAAVARGVSGDLVWIFFDRWRVRVVD